MRSGMLSMPSTDNGFSDGEVQGLVLGPWQVHAANGLEQIEREDLGEVDGLCDGLRAVRA